METYDPMSESTPITDVPQNVEILSPEKNVDEDQMADFSSPIDEVIPGPGQMIQNEIMGPPSMLAPSNQAPKKKAQSGNPFGLTDDQFLALIAGVSAVITFSEPVPGKLSSYVPKFFSESGKHSITGMIVSALVAAIVFYFAKQFIKDR